LTKLLWNIPEGEEKWDCSAQTTETQPYLSALPNGILNKRKSSEQSSTEGNDQADSESDEVIRPNKKVDETNKDETETNEVRKSRRKKRDREEEKTKDRSSGSSLYKTVKDNETLDYSIAEKSKYSSLARSQINK
jgi:hypothetical protein